MNQKDITKLNHSLRYINLELEEEQENYYVYDSLEDSYGKSCPVCDKDYLIIEWEPIILQGDIVEYVYCPICQSKVVQAGGEIIYNGISKTWNEKYLPLKRS